MARAVFWIRNPNGVWLKCYKRMLFECEQQFVGRSVQEGTKNGYEKLLILFKNAMFHPLHLPFTFKIVENE